MPPQSGAARVRAHRARCGAAAKARADNIETINSLYGIEDQPGFSMLMWVLSRHAFAFLPDEAIDELARVQREAVRQSAEKQGG